MTLNELKEIALAVHVLNHGDEHCEFMDAFTPELCALLVDVMIDAKDNGFQTIGLQESILRVHAHLAALSQDEGSDDG